MKVARAAIMIALGIVIPLLVQLWDKRRLDDEQRARSWNFASWACALYAFGPASMLGWYWVTRRGWRRVYGLPAMLLIAIAITLVDGALEWLSTP